MINFQARENQLQWPRDIFLTELEEVADDPRQLHHLLKDAFVGDALSGRVTSPWSGIETAELTRELQSRSTEIQVLQPRRYYLERSTSGPGDQTPRWGDAFAAWASVVFDLDATGWLDGSFGKDCVDDPRHEQPADKAARDLGFAVQWPPRFEHLGLVDLTEAQDKTEIERFLSAVEWVGDHVARPRLVQREHTFGSCGLHYTEFSIETGQQLYWARVNTLLEQLHIPFTIATTGSDTGYVVERVDDARAELLSRAVDEAPADSRGEITQAISRFRRHGADRDDKRAAVMVLSRIIEDLRAEVKTHLLTKDEAGLFEIANRYDIRHRNEAQKSDYRTEMLDWIFWLDLATIELMYSLRSNP